MSELAASQTITAQLPQCRLYHPLSELGSRSGYYPNLTDEHIQSMAALDQLILADGLDVATDEEDLFLKKLRFLRARSFDAQNAFEMIKKDTVMRNDHARAGLRHESASEVLQCDLAAIYNRFPTWVQGFDNQSRPIAYRNFGKKFEIWEVLKLTSMENLVRFHAWEGEQALRIMRSKSDECGCNIETFVVVIDAKGWHIGLATSDAFAYIKGMASTDSDHYPERLGRLLVINAPSTLSFAWKVIKRFLDDVTRSKIEILSGPEQWQPVMQSFIDPNQIPIMYGGTAPDPTPEDAINSINPPPRELVPLSEQERVLEKEQKAVENVDQESIEILKNDFEKLVQEDDCGVVCPPSPPLSVEK